MNNRVIAASLGIEYVPDEKEPIVEDSEEVVEDSEVEEETVEVLDPVSELLGPEPVIGHVEQDYEFTRKKMKSVIEKGDAALSDLMDMVKEEPNARAFEVVATMIKTMSDVTTSFFDLQKRNKELHQGSLAAIGGKPDIAIRNGVVFAGDSAAMLQHLKNKQKESKQ